MSSQRPKTLGIDRTKLRLAVLAIIIVTAFVALFSRLWFLQVLASEDYRALAKENRVRRIETEPIRGRILARDGEVLVDNRKSLAVTIDPQIVDTPEEERLVLYRLSKALDRPLRELKKSFNAPTVSPYKAIAVAYDVDEEDAFYVAENNEEFPGVDRLKLSIRVFPQGNVAAQILGYVGEISPSQLKSSHFKGARPRYRPGDRVGQSGVEYWYDPYLRGTPGIQKLIVDSVGEPVEEPVEITEPEVGQDLILGMDLDIQRVTESALANGVAAAGGRTGGVVVMDPNTGDVVAMASFPSFDPSKLADGITEKEFDQLGAKTPKINEDDALLNRTIQGTFPPGSTFKLVTAAAAMATGVAEYYTTLGCPGSIEYAGTVFPNWTSADFGTIDFEKSLAISCDTFYYQLGWAMENQYGAALGDGSERFQDFMRLMSFGHETGIDLPYEFSGVVPDKAWCESYQKQGFKNWCAGVPWLGGYTVNMSIGQGDLTVTPLQMAIAYAAIANDGYVMRPRVAQGIGESVDLEENAEAVNVFQPEIRKEVPLEDIEIDTIETGLTQVVQGGGTGASAFYGFPLTAYPIAGKTGTAERGETGQNYAWFVSYGPVGTPEYVISVYVDNGHGGETAAPIAREIWEGIFELDDETAIQLGSDASN